VRLDPAAARERFAGQPVARLATVRDGAPRLVPIVFALIGDVLYTAVDAKPKTTTALRRLDDIRASPAVCVLVDHYEADWTHLWWARADGQARVLDAGRAGGAADEEAHTALRGLTERYPVYRSQPPPGPVIAVDVTRWSGWSAE
jgi:PPOX class probable F420-dependent enzyme